MQTSDPSASLFPICPDVPTPISVAFGDGIGPGIMAATLRVLHAAGARLDIERVDLGERVYRQGVTSGIERSAWDSLRRTGVLLKAPVTTPQGGGYESLNVTLRKTLGLYANVRPCRAYAPLPDAASSDGPGDHQRKRGGPVRGHRTPPDPRGGAVPEAHHP